MLPSRPTVGAINRGHPANRNLHCSALLSGGYPTDLVRGLPLTFLNSTTAAWTETGGLGTTLNCGINLYGQFQGPTYPALKGSSNTLAVICTLAATNNSYSPLGTAYYLAASGGNWWVWNNGVVNQGLFGAVALNVPHLVAVSFLDTGTTSTNRLTAVLVRFDTGAISTFDSTNFNRSGSTEINPIVANAVTVAGSQRYFGQIAAVLINRTYMPLAELLAWAQDPWGPWRVPLASWELDVSSVVPPGSACHGLPLMGVGCSLLPIFARRAVQNPPASRRDFLRPRWWLE